MFEAARTWVWLDRAMRRVVGYSKNFSFFSESYGSQCRIWRQERGTT